MISCHVTARDGMTFLNPSVERMRGILATLAEEEPISQPEVWLMHPSGWELVMYPSGLVRYAKADAGAREPVRELRGVDAETALELWLHLSRGEFEALEKLPWALSTDEEEEGEEP